MCPRQDVIEKVSVKAWILTHPSVLKVVTCEYFISWSENFRQVRASSTCSRGNSSSFSATIRPRAETYSPDVHILASWTLLCPVSYVPVKICYYSLQFVPIITPLGTHKTFLRNIWHGYASSFPGLMTYTRKTEPLTWDAKTVSYTPKKSKKKESFLCPEWYIIHCGGGAISNKFSERCKCHRFFFK